MAGLGAGAGAFEGDMERAKLAEERRQADLANQRAQQQIAQRDNEFRINLGEEQKNQAENTRRFDLTQGAAKDQTAYERGRNAMLDKEAAGRNRFEQDRANRLDAEGAAKNRFDMNRASRLDARAENQDEWGNVLNGLSAEQKALEIEQNRQTLDAYQKAALQEREMLANREKVAKSNMASAIATTLQFGVLPKGGLDLISKSTGMKVQGMYALPDGKGVGFDVVNEKGEIENHVFNQAYVNNAAKFLNGVDVDEASSGRGGYRGASSYGASELQQEKMDYTRERDAMRSIERRIDSYSTKIKDLMPGDALYDELKPKIDSLQATYDKLDEGVNADLYGKYGVAKQKEASAGKDSGGNILDKIKSPAVRAIYGMSPDELKLRLGKVAKATGMNEEAVLSSWFKNESPEVKQLFFGSSK